MPGTHGFAVDQLAVTKINQAEYVMGNLHRDQKGACVNRTGREQTDTHEYNIRRLKLEQSWRDTQAKTLSEANQESK